MIIGIAFTNLLSRGSWMMGAVGKTVEVDSGFFFLGGLSLSWIFLNLSILLAALCFDNSRTSIGYNCFSQSCFNKSAKSLASAIPDSSLP